MINVTEEGVWNRLLEDDPKLRKLAIAAGVENNPERAQDLGWSLVWNCGEGVITNEAEDALATYLFCMSDPSAIRRSLSGRKIMAQAAGEYEDVAVINQMLSEID